MQEDYYFRELLLSLMRLKKKKFCVTRVKIESTNVQLLTLLQALLEIFRLLGDVFSCLLQHPRVRCFPTQTQSHLTRPRLSHFETPGGLRRRWRLRDIPASSVDDVVLVTAVR